jgi:hypothetical protein
MKEPTILRADGTTEKFGFEGVEPSLKEMQEVVGGLIDLVHLNGGMSLVVNDEGLVYNMPLNRGATSLYMAHGGGTPLVGDAILISTELLK